MDIVARNEHTYLDLWVNNETDPLETLMLGSSQGLPPAPAPNRCYDAKTRETVLNNTYPSQKEIENEFDVAVEILKKHEIEIIRPQKLELCNQVFARDVAFVIEDKFICSNILPEREEEIHAMQENLINKVNPKRLINLPEDAHIEGGDVILHNEHIFVGTYRGRDYAQYKSARTNEKAVRMLQEFFPHKNIISFDLQKNDRDPYKGILHLDCCFQPVGKDKAILYRNGFVYDSDYKYIKSFFGEENIFEVTREEMYYMYPNVFSISPSVVMVEKNFARLKRHMETQWNMTVEALPYFEISKLGGLLRCSTMPLKRKRNE